MKTFKEFFNEETTTADIAQVPSRIGKIEKRTPAYDIKSIEDILQPYGVSYKVEGNNVSFGFYVIKIGKNGYSLYKKDKLVDNYKNIKEIEKVIENEYLNEAYFGRTQLKNKLEDYIDGLNTIVDKNNKKGIWDTDVENILKNIKNSLSNIENNVKQL